MANYTTQERIDLPSLTEHYALREPVLTPLPGGAANSSFHLASSAGDFVLTILDNHEQPSAERLAAHIQALFHLNLPTTEVVPTVDGTLVSHLGGRPAVLKKWIAGEVQHPLSVTLLPEAGRILAQLHTVPPNSPGLKDVPVGTRRLSPDHEAVIPQFQDNDFARWLTERLDRIRAAEAGRNHRSTLIHGDLFDDNIVVRQEGQLSVLDWETLSLDDPLLDLGMAAVGLAQENGTLVPKRLEALISGYQQIMPLTQPDKAALPLKIEHAALIIAFHRYYRHNIRYPDPDKSSLHIGMIKFIEAMKD